MKKQTKPAAGPLELPGLVSAKALAKSTTWENAASRYAVQHAADVADEFRTEGRRPVKFLGLP